MDNNLIWTIVIIFFALLFDYYNGANDAANSISTIVATKVLKPTHAVVWAAFFNFISFLILGTAVAKTIGKGIVDINVVDNYVVASTTLGAALWVMFCTNLGLPISASHSLVGGLIGPVLVKVGKDGLIYSGIYKVFLFIVLSPLIGFLLGGLSMIIVYNIFKNKHPQKVEKIFRVGQLFSSALYAIGHGGNDAQKTIGIITMTLYANGYLTTDGSGFHVPFWVALLSYTTIALGTLAGGWKVVSTLGHRLTKLRPVDGFAAEFGAAATLHSVTLLGIPVSTTHTITGSIMAVGALKRFYSVKWSLSRKIIWSWILTIPGSALISMIIYSVLKILL
jgi:PiT family inorganic phosphate transporter